MLATLCRERVQPVYLGDHTAICRILGRYKLYLDTRDHHFSAHVLLDGFWEMWVTKFIAMAVAPGMVAVDVGANFGYYTLLLGDLVGTDGRVIAVEPNPVVLPHLRNSVSINGFYHRTTIIAAAAGAVAKDGVQLYTPQWELGGATVVDDPVPEQISGAPYSVVPQVTLDPLIAEVGQLDFVKIDAEGAEGAIIEGLEQSLKRYKPVLILEFNALRGESPGALLDRLISIYGSMRFLDSFGAMPTNKARVMSKDRGENWMLLFTASSR